MRRIFSKVGLARVNTRPIVILGNQKSGTTAIAALLSRSTGETVTLDIKGMYEPAQSRLHRGEMDFKEFVHKNGADFSRRIVKEPCLTFLYPMVKEFFPEARFVMIVRDPRDNIRSILNRLNLPGDLDDLDESVVAGLSPEWQMIVDGSWLGLRGKTYIDMLALRWNLGLKPSLDHPSELILIRYEDFMQDKVSVISELARILKLRRRKDISEVVDFQFQPRGDRDVSWVEFFGQENLIRVESVCADAMRQFGYLPHQEACDE